MAEHIKPQSLSWAYRGASPTLPGCRAYVYDHLDGTRILSAVEPIKDEGLNYHISISQNGRRVSLQHARQVLMGMAADFPAEQWFEDNHQSSIARNFWCHVDPSQRKPCACVGKEKPHQEGDFLWRDAPELDGPLG